MNQDNILDLQETSPSLLTQAAEKYLLNSSRWAFFLSIVGIITITMLILVFGFIGSTFMEMIVDSPMGPMGPSLGAGTLGFLLFLYLLIIGLPTWFLFQFATKTKKAIETQDPILLESGLRFHKFFFTFYGVITAFFIGLNLLGFLGILLT